MQRQRQSIQLQRRQLARHEHARNFLGVNSRAHAAGLAQAMQIARKPIRNIHPCGHAALHQPLAQFQRRLGIELRRQQLFPARLAMHPAQDQFQPQLRRAQPPAGENRVAGPSRASTQQAPAPRRSHDSDVQRDLRIFLRPLRGIASGQTQAELARRSRHAGEHVIEPASGAICGNRQAEEENFRLRSHRCDVAGGASQRLVADRIGRARLRQEVNVLQERIARNHPIRARRRTQHSRVVADAQPQRAAFRRRNPPPDTFDQTFFGNIHCAPARQHYRLAAAEKRSRWYAGPVSSTCPSVQVDLIPVSRWKICENYG